MYLLTLYSFLSTVADCERRLAIEEPTQASFSPADNAASSQFSHKVKRKFDDFDSSSDQTRAAKKYKVGVLNVCTYLMF